MKRTIFKWTGRAVVALLLFGFGWYATVYVRTERRMAKHYNVRPEAISIKTDSAALARGAHLVAMYGCQDCHGEDFGGRVMEDNFILGRLAAPNLTRGRGGLPAQYNETDFFLALRHGLRRDGQPLVIMPSQNTAELTEADLAALIAYVQQQPPVDREIPEQKFGPGLRIFADAGKLPLLAAEIVDHKRPLPPPIEPAVTASYGAYVGVMCRDCHGPQLKGGPAMAPGMPDVPNLSSNGATGRWTEAQFLQTLRTGQTPEGKVLDNGVMPWKLAAQYSDEELKALYLYLKSL
jgi:cytochrome c553